MKITQINNDKKTNFKAFITDPKTAKKISQSITNVRSVSEESFMLGLNKNEEEAYSDYYLTNSEFINYVIKMAKGEGKTFLDTILKKAKVIKIEDVEKIIPELQTAEKIFNETKNNIIKKLSLDSDL